MEVIKSKIRSWESENGRKIRRTINTATSFWEFCFYFTEENLPLMQFVRITSSVEEHRSIHTPINPTKESVRSITDDLVEKLESESSLEEAIAEVKR